MGITQLSFKDALIALQFGNTVYFHIPYLGAGVWLVYLLSYYFY